MRLEMPGLRSVHVQETLKLSYICFEGRKVKNELILQTLLKFSG